MRDSKKINAYSMVGKSKRKMPHFSKDLEIKYPRIRGASGLQKVLIHIWLRLKRCLSALAIIRVPIPLASPYLNCSKEGYNY